MPRVLPVVLLFGLGFGLVACDRLTDVPDWDTTWVVQTPSTTLSVNTLLPSGVTATANGFLVTVPPVMLSRRLADDCPACASFTGQRVPKPAFVGTGTVTAPMPTGVTSATLAPSRIRVVLRHGFGFDPLRPSSTARGWVRVVATSNGIVVGKDSVHGATTLFPSNTDLVRDIVLAGEVGRGAVLITSTLNSPAGDSVTLQGNALFSASATFPDLTVTRATVALTNQSVALEPMTLDLRDVDLAIRNRAQGGRITVTMENPFAVTGVLTATFTGGPSTVTKSMQVSGGSLTQDLILSKSELRTLLGRTISMRASGQVTGALVTLVPGQTAAVSSRLRFTLTREARP